MKRFLKAHPHRIVRGIKCRRGASRMEGDFVIEAKRVQKYFPRFCFIQIEHFGVFYD